VKHHDLSVTSSLPALARQQAGAFTLGQLVGLGGSPLCVRLT
jgi:hypothetical protein